MSELWDELVHWYYLFKEAISPYKVSFEEREDSENDY